MKREIEKTIAGIKVTAEPGIDIDIATTAKPFTDWLETLDRDKFDIRALHFNSVTMFSPTRAGFLKWTTDVVDRQGRWLPGTIFARGGAVTVICVLICEAKSYAVVTVQPRLATGDFQFVELCAGMLDDSGHFAGTAAKELKEELHIEVDAADLVDMSELAGHDRGVFLSPGACEETMRFFAYCRRISRSELEAMNGRCTGLAEEGEQITLKIVELDEVLSLADAKSLIAYSLYMRFKDQIKVHE